MNLKIKFRESFRPFAPVVLPEHAPSGSTSTPAQESPYMLLVAPVRERASRRRSRPTSAQVMENDPDLRQRVNVVALDRSRRSRTSTTAPACRPSTTQRNPRFYRLLKAFHQLTGCPVLVNTSFNVRGEPIVCTPAGRLPLLPGHRHGRAGAGRLSCCTRKTSSPGRGPGTRSEYLAQFQLD